MWVAKISGLSIYLIPETALLLLMQICEPLAADLILPFLFQLVNETGITQGNEDRTGYYAGIIVRSILLDFCSDN